MNFLSLSFFVFISLLLVLFFSSLRGKSKRTASKVLPNFPDDSGNHHVIHMPQIRQALTASDRDFLLQRAGSKLANRIERERKAVALRYLTALQSDFEKLVQQAKLIALLSPEVVAVHELERVRLSFEFSFRCSAIRLRILFGTTPLSQLATIGDIVSGLTVRIEGAMRELGERAAAASNLASSLDTGDVDVA